MRRIITLSAVAALIAPASAVARKHHPVAQHKVPPPLCAPDTSPYKSRSMPYRRTLASGALAQVYSVGAAPPRLVGLQNGDRPIYGCVYGHRGAWRLGAEPFDDGGKYMNLDIYGDRNVTLAGTFVAFESYVTGDWLCGFQFHVVVEDLNTGKVLRREPVGTRAVPDPTSECGEFGLGDATAIVVTADGAVAWVFQPIQSFVEAGLVAPGYQVRVADANGSRVLAAGSDIDPSSLALGGGTLYWTQGGVARSAALR